MKVFKIDYNWQDETRFKTCEVGLGMVTEITEHPAAGEGDKWFYDVMFSNGQMIRIFNPNKVYYQ